MLRPVRFLLSLFVLTLYLISPLQTTGLLAQATPENPNQTPPPSQTPNPPVQQPQLSEQHLGTSVKFILTVPSNFSGSPKLKVWEGQNCSGNDYYINNVSFNHQGGNTWTYEISINAFGPNITGQLPYHSFRAFDNDSAITSCKNGGSTSGPPVQTPPPTINCNDWVMPSFSGTLPSPLKQGQPSLLIFSAPSGALSANQYRVKVDKEGANSIVKTLSQVNNTTYKADLGAINAGNYDWHLMLTNPASANFVNCPSGEISVLNRGQLIDNTGQLPANVQKVVDFAVSFGIGIAGGVAFLLLIYGGFKFIFSAGNPESVQQGREIITAAIIGLIVVVFSVFLLRLIGISILGLPIL